MLVECFTLGANGLEKMKDIGKLPIHSRVYSFGFGMSDNVWGVMDNDNNLVKMSPNYEEDYFCSPYHKFDSYDRPLSKKFGIGFYYDDINSDFRYTKEQIDNAIVEADRFNVEQRLKAKLEAEANQREMDSLPSKYPHLTPLTVRDDKFVKQNLVADLKYNFPDVKFSVKKTHYGCYNVRWVDGVTVEAVDRVVKKYVDHKSDWSGDFRDYAPSNFNHVFGGFDYVFTNRDYSDPIRALFSDDWKKDDEYNSILRSALYDSVIPKFETVQIINGELIYD